MYQGHKFQASTSSSCELRMVPVHKDDGTGKSSLVFKISRSPYNKPLVEGLILPNFSECFSYRKRFPGVTSSAFTEHLVPMGNDNVISMGESGYAKGWDLQENIISNDLTIQRTCPQVIDREMTFENGGNLVKEEAYDFNNERLSLKIEDDEMKDEILPLKYGERRRSIRLQALHSKPKVLLETATPVATKKVKRNVLDSSRDSRQGDAARKTRRMKSRGSSKAGNSKYVDSKCTQTPTLGRGNAKHIRGRERVSPNQTILCKLSPSGTLINDSPISSNKKSQVFDPSFMRLKNMLLRSGTFPTSLHNHAPANAILPKFANVDTSHVLSSLGQQQTKSANDPAKRQIALFFTKRGNAIQSLETPQTNRFVKCKESAFYTYYWRKIKRDATYLARKYQMLDLATLDNCYGKFASLKRFLK